MIYRYDDTKVCLNGLWDFKPQYGKPETAPPREGWISGVYAVPSFYNLPYDGVREKGEEYFRSDSELVLSEDAENLFDAFGYPREWSKANTSWYRRFLTLHKQEGRRSFIVFEGIGPRASVFLNGKPVAEHDDSCLPCRIDVTDIAIDGDNELCVFIDDFVRDDNGAALYPTGNWIPASMRGIWQNVWLVERGEVYVEDVTVVTSVRKSTLSLKYDIKNTASTSKAVVLQPCVRQLPDGEIIKLPELSVEAPANDNATASLDYEWKSPLLWDSDNPNLYMLDTSLECGTIHDFCAVRFGFRELWSENGELMLNGFPLHLFSDWGHKVTPYNHTEDWVKKWFGMLRDYNMNASRLHTHPHPEFILDMADEYGIYITSESALHGAGGGQGTDDPRYWENARRHITRQVAREKNHPCVILYSCENEMRWNKSGTALHKTELPKMRELYNTLDPTRLAYHEGDSSLWAENTQDIISRHYGRDVAGSGWWDHKKPLHSAEFCLYHYAGPNNTSHLIGDSSYGDYRNVIHGAALDLLYVAEDARANGVCCLGPWNLYCLINLRTHGEQHFEYSDYTTPGVKPKIAHEGSSEFEFWSDGKGYTPFEEAGLQAVAFRPFAVIDTGRKSSYYCGAICKKHITAVNDTPSEVAADVSLEILDGERVLCRVSKQVSLGRGMRIAFDADLIMPGDEGTYTYKMSAVSDGRLLDEQIREITVKRPAFATIKSRIAVFGAGTARGLLDALKADYSYVGDLSDLSGFDIVLLEKDSVEAGSTVNKNLSAFINAGGRAVILEQRFSPAPAFKLSDKAVISAFKRAHSHPTVAGISDSELSFWGEDAYTLMSGDSRVAVKMYEKDDGSAMLPILDSDEGDFGDGGLRYTPMFVCRQGEGAAVFCQLRVTERLNDCPAARALIVNMLVFADGYNHSKNQPVVADNSENVDAALEFAMGGGDAIIKLNAETAPALEKALGIKAVSVPEKYGTNLERASDNPLTDGISNEDICGIERFLYSPARNENCRVAEYGISDDERITPLVVTSPKSAMSALYEHGGASEMLHTYTALHHSIRNNDTPITVIGEMKHEAGRIIISGFEPEKKKLRFDRVYNRLIENLGGEVAHPDPFEGKCIDSGDGGPGYPEKVYLLTDYTQEAFEKVNALCTYLTERMNTMPALEAAPFKAVTGDGSITGSGETLIYFPLMTSAPRKNVGSNLGVPDPGAQTFLDVYAEGSAKLFINSRCVGEAVSNEGAMCFPDLELESGLNHIALIWKPDAPNASLKMLWRNILRRPEYGFLFDNPFETA